MIIAENQLHGMREKYSHTKTLADFQRNISIIHERINSAWSYFNQTRKNVL